MAATARAGAVPPPQRSPSHGLRSWQALNGLADPARQSAFVVSPSTGPSPERLQDGVCSENAANVRTNVSQVGFGFAFGRWCQDNHVLTGPKASGTIKSSNSRTRPKNQQSSITVGPGVQPSVNQRIDIGRQYLGHPRRARLPWSTWATRRDSRLGRRSPRSRLSWPAVGG